MLAGTSIREKVTPCPENRPAADKFQKGKRTLVEQRPELVAPVQTVLGHVLLALVATDAEPGRAGVLVD